MPRSNARLIPAAAIVFAAGLSTPSLGQDATYRIVARTGQVAPGGGFFSSLGYPVISHTGRVAFKGVAIGPLGTRGVWSEGVSGMNNLERVTRKGDTIPGMNGTFVGDIGAGSGIAMNASGEIAFSVPITGVQAQYGEYAFLAHDANGVKRLAVPGQLVSVSCGGIGCQRWLTDIDPSGFAVNAAGLVAIRATIDGPGINSTNSHLLMVTDGTSTQVVMREGDVAPGASGLVFSSMHMAQPHMNDHGEILIRNWIHDLNTNDQYWSAWRGAPGSVSIVEAENRVAPIGGTFSDAHTDGGLMGLNNAGQALFLQRVRDNIGDERYGLWLNSNGQTQAVCFEGMPAPGGLTYLYPGWSRPGSLNSSGAVAFRAFVQGPGVNANNDGVMIRRMPNGSQSIVAREGAQAPGLANGVVLLHLANIGEHILDDGRVVYRAQLAGPGIHAGNDDSLWITRDGAPPALLIRTGQTMSIGGQLKTVEEYASSLNQGSESGVHTGVSRLGQVVIRVTFTDATQAIIVASPESACPGDVNGDGVVNFADLNEMLGAFGHAGDVIDADLDLDGDVDFADLNQVLSNFGLDCP